MYISFDFKRTVKTIAIISVVIILTVTSALISLNWDKENISRQTAEELSWVQFDLTEKIMTDALDFDIKSHAEIDDVDENTAEVDWIKLLAYLSAKYWGDTDRYKKSDMTEAVERIKNGENIDEIGGEMKLYSYYCTAYEAVLGGMVGDYSYSDTDENGETVIRHKYGLKAFSPIAAGYYYEHYDDFGASRSYGYKRNHLGHDLLGSLGTPIISVESGIVEEVGWNRYGGWRIGIRSLDSKRYYYYAHLKKDHPYPENLKKGSIVTVGDVIGYMGRTGYSTNENVNGMTKTHLHWGMQLIFDEAKKDSPGQIWIDLYEITKFLSKHRLRTISAGNDKDFVPSTQINDPELEKFAATQAYTGGIVNVPVLMYHSILKSADGKNDYVITPAQFEQDLKFIRDNGFTTVTTQNLIDYVSGRSKLPEKPVVLTFDDGNYNNYFYVYPLLKEYNMKAVISVVGKYTEAAQKLKEDNPNYSSITWDQINEMMSSGLVEFQNHSYDLHDIKNGIKGVQKKSSESDAEYEKRILEDLKRLQNLFKENTDYTPTAFAYPYGALGKDTGSILKELGVSASYTSAEGMNTLTIGDSEGLYFLKRNIRTPQKSAEQILNKFK